MNFVRLYFRFVVIKVDVVLRYIESVDHVQYDDFKGNRMNILRCMYTHKLADIIITYSKIIDHKVVNDIWNYWTITSYEKLIQSTNCQIQSSCKNKKIIRLQMLCSGNKIRNLLNFLSSSVFSSEIFNRDGLISVFFLLKSPWIYQNIRHLFLSIFLLPFFMRILNLYLKCITWAQHINTSKYHF